MVIIIRDNFEKRKPDDNNRGNIMYSVKKKTGEKLRSLGEENKQFTHNKILFRDKNAIQLNWNGKLKLLCLDFALGPHYFSFSFLFLLVYNKKEKKYVRKILLNCFVNEKKYFEINYPSFLYSDLKQTVMYHWWSYSF